MKANRILYFMILWEMILAPKLQNKQNKTKTQAKAIKDKKKAFNSTEFDYNCVLR